MHEEAKIQEVSAERFAAPVALNRLQTLALIVGVIGLGLSVVLALFGGAEALKQFFYSYLSAYILWVGVTLGSFGLLMVQFVARGAWGVTIRRILEASVKNLPLMFLLFIPILIDVFGFRTLFPWTHHDAPFVVNDAGRTNEILQKKSLYLDSGWFAVRFVLYFIIWGGIAWFIGRWSRLQDETFQNPARSNYYANMMRNISGPGIVIFALTVTFAATDWVMSLDPEWYSTIFGILFMGGWGLSALAFAVLMIVFLNNHQPMRGILTRTHFHDLGKLLLALVMLWSYFSVSQLLIIWSGNLPEEIPWFLRRMRGGWGTVSILLVACQFALPFLLLLSRRTKRDARFLGAIASTLR